MLYYLQTEKDKGNTKQNIFSSSHQTSSEFAT